MPKRTSRKKLKSKRKFESIPKDFHTVTPYLVVKGGAQAVEWYKKVFAAKELDRQVTSEGLLVHSQLKIGDSLIMLSDVFPGGGKDPIELGGSPVRLHIYTKNVDELWKHALESGARVDMELDNMFWGERYGQLTDPFGHQWSLSMRIPMSAQEMEKQRQEAMKMFEQGQHP